MLPREVQSLVKTPQEKRVLEILKNLLASGADINVHKAAALCIAVKAADTQVTEILLTAKPSPVSLATALPHAVHIPDHVERLTFTQRLLEAGTPAAEANRALCYVINAFEADVPLISILVAKADTSDAEALGLAIKKENPDVVELILRRKQQSPSRLNAILLEATKVQNRDARIAICESLLRAGASGSILSDALLVAASEGDVGLGEILMKRGANIEDHDGKAAVEACRCGAADVLQMLLGGDKQPQKSTLEKAFQAATEVGDLNKRAAIFQILLGKGVGGEVVDSQLVSAVRYGDEGQALVKVLLQAGANPDYNSGEAVWAATRSALLGNLEMILGSVEVGGSQVRPSYRNPIR
jgi:hypothetical protein